MKRYGHSKSSIFLMEIIINILLFSVLLTISLEIIMKAHTLTADTVNLHRAVTTCANIAGCFESGDGSLDSIREIYPLGSGSDSNLILYFDDHFSSCPKEDAVYAVSVNYIHDSSTEAYSSHLKEIRITCSGNEKMIYSIKACHYRPLSAQTRIGGA